MDFRQIQVTKLRKVYELDNFDCGDQDINDFLKNDALKWQEKKIAVTRIFIYQDEIVGFYCISADAIKLKNDEKENDTHLQSKRLTEVPAVKIGRLGRSIKYKDQKLGEFILQWAIGHILSLSELIGVRFVTVDA